jgi:hypothetical protein
VKEWDKRRNVRGRKICDRIVPGDERGECQPPSQHTRYEKENREENHLQKTERGDLWVASFPKDGIKRQIAFNASPSEKSVVHDYVRQRC